MQKWPFFVSHTLQHLDTARHTLRWSLFNSPHYITVRQIMHHRLAESTMQLLHLHSCPLTLHPVLPASKAIGNLLESNFAYSTKTCPLMSLSRLKLHGNKNDVLFVPFELLFALFRASLWMRKLKTKHKWVHIVLRGPCMPFCWKQQKYKSVWIQDTIQSVAFLPAVPGAPLPEAACVWLSGAGRRMLLTAGVGVQL